MQESLSAADIARTLSGLSMDSRVNRLVLFGSHALGTAGKRSDLDLYLDSGRQITGFDFFALKAILEEAFRRDIDLLPDLDVVPGSKVSREIQRYGVIVYAKG